MLVCDLCGSKDIRQEASIMISPNDPENQDALLQDFFLCDYYLCMTCNEECQPITDPHEKPWPHTTKEKKAV